MTTINSVTGPIDCLDLGFTLMHEHILVTPPGVYQNYPELLGENLMRRVVDDLKKAKEGGIDTIVDTTTLDLGRDINLLAEASCRSGVNIVACTGWWLDIPRFFDGVCADQLAEVFIREVEKGIGGTDIKAGILKSASDIEGVTPKSETILRAVARAHLTTGVPIILHSYSPGQVGVSQLTILKEEGVDLSKIKMDHSNDTTDVEYLFWILDQGCYLGMDRYPGCDITKEIFPSSLARTKTLKTLMDAGYTDRICLSHDRAILKVQPASRPITEEERRRDSFGYLYIKYVVFPQLREMGVAETEINRLCVTAPRNFFEGV